MRLVAGAIAVAGVAALALPGAAAAHGRGATIALDYRLHLDPASTSLPGVHVRVLDGDRALEARVDEGVQLLVRGLAARAAAPHRRRRRVGERAPRRRPRPTGSSRRPARAGSSSATDARSRGTTTGSRRRRRRSRASAGRFTIPVAVDGKAAVIGGTFVRVARPAVWPWLLGALARCGGDLGGGAAEAVAGRRSRSASASPPGSRRSPP